MIAPAGQPRILKSRNPNKQTAPHRIVSIIHHHLPVTHEPHPSQHHTKDSMGKRRLKARVREAGEAFEQARDSAVDSQLEAARPDEELFFVDTEARWV